MRLVPILCLVIGGVTLLAGGGAAAAARHEQAHLDLASPTPAEPAAAVSETPAPAPKAPRSITSPSPFAMGVLTLLAVAEMYRRRRKFVVDHAAL